MKRTYFMLLLLLFVTVLSALGIAPSDGDGDGKLEISNKDHLLYLSQDPGADWTADYEQTANIVFEEADFLEGGSFYNAGAGFSPIGDWSTKFSGTYNGQGHTIDGLFIDRYGESGEDDIGLFGYIREAGINNLHVRNIEITGNNQVGALIGTSMHSTVENCSAEGSVTGFQAVGGLIGKIIYVASIDNCFSEGSVTGIFSSAGTKSSDIGGLAGTIIGSSESSWFPSINNSYSTSDVSGASYTGGFSGVIQDCNISYCYCIGSVSNSENTGFGGFTGSASGSCTVTGCFWDVETSTLGGSSGDNNGGAIGKTTTQMKTESTFTDASWDFTTIWDMDAGVSDGYPYLLENAPDIPLPIGLSSFNAVANNGVVIVTWITGSETENAAFRIYRDNEMIAELEGAGTTSEPQDYVFIDHHVIPGESYTYVLADVTIGNQEVKHSDKAVTISVGEGNVGKDYSIGSSYPNPFNPMCFVPLNLAASAEVNAVLYDLNGRILTELRTGALAAGSHDLKIDGANLATGIYLVKIQINDALHVQKIALMK